LVFEVCQIFGNKNWQIFWKTVIFGNIAKFGPSGNAGHWFSSHPLLLDLLAEMTPLIDGGTFCQLLEKEVAMELPRMTRFE